MRKSWLLFQSFILLCGTVFAWTNAVVQIQNFYGLYGTFLKFKDCVVPNPLTTACLYGSVAFLVAFIWSIRMLQNPSGRGQRYLRNFLIFCVLFAGSVVTLEFGEFYGFVSTTVPSVGCTPGVAPTLTPCFYGMLFFIGALLVSWGIVRHTQ